MSVPDEVRKQIGIEAPVERVWAALTTPDGLLGWFPTERAEIDLRAGGRLSLVWPEDAGEGLVVVVEPPARLVFRWRPAGTDRPFTTVAFTWAEIQAGTRLTLVGSGFASLPDQIAQRSRVDNDAGWAEELGALKTYLEAA